MTRHPLDPLSLLSGMFFTAAGLWVLLTDADARFIDGRWTWPVLLVAAGLAMMASVAPRRPRDASVEGGNGDPDDISMPAP